MSAIQLNDRWRVRLDDPAQWILECQRGAQGKKHTKYTGRSYCTQRTSLLRCIRDDCGDVDHDALALIEALPERFPYNTVRQDSAPDGRGRGRNSLGRSVATVPSPINGNISNDEYKSIGIRRQCSLDPMCSPPPEQTRAINCSRPARTLPREGISERPTVMVVAEG